MLKERKTKRRFNLAVSLRNAY